MTTRQAISELLERVRAADGTDFTLDREIAAIAADASQPFFPLGFSVYYRNPGHWDVSAEQCPGKASAWLSVDPAGRQTSERDGQQERAFRIRGEPGNVIVMDERWNPHKPGPRGNMVSQTVSAAMLWIVEELMQEPGRP